jgi:hypothetical protein
MEDIVEILKKAKAQKRKRVASTTDQDHYYTLIDEGYRVIGDSSLLGISCPYYTKSYGQKEKIPIQALFCLFSLNLIEVLLKLINDNLKQSKEVREVKHTELLQFLGVWLILAIEYTGLKCNMKISQL